MGIDIIIFILAIVFGIFLYWRESKNNRVYRFFNKILNSEALQMTANNPKGFIYKQPFIPRLLFVVIALLIVGVIIQFLTPIEVFTSYFALSGLATFITGTLIGSYLANFVIKTTEVVEEKSESLGDFVEDAIEKSKDFIEDFKTKAPEVTTKVNKDATPKTNTQSARDRLKDKGLM